MVYCLSLQTKRGRRDITLAQVSQREVVLQSFEQRKVVESCTIGRANIRHCPTRNGSVYLVGGGSRIILVECNHYDVKVGYDGGRSKEILEPIPSVCDTSIVAVILNVGL